MRVKVFITGASGFVGRSIASSLAAQNLDVLGTDIALPPTTRAYRQLQGDLASMDLIELFLQEKPDWIIHCAGNANVGLSVTDPLMDLNSSIYLLHRLLYSIKAAAISPKVLFFSSAAVYGNPSSLPIREQATRHPVSPYGFHKSCCEDLCSYFSRVEGIECRSVRVFSAYGAGLQKQILWDLFRKALEIGPITMFGTGAETRDFIHIQDVVQAARLVLEHGNEEIYNVANATEVRIDHIASLMLSQMNQPLERLLFNKITKLGDPIHWVADTTRLRALGYKQTVALEQGVSDYVKWAQRIE